MSLIIRISTKLPKTICNLIIDDYGLTSNARIAPINFENPNNVFHQTVIGFEYKSIDDLESRPEQLLELISLIKKMAAGEPDCSIQYIHNQTGIYEDLLQSELWKHWNETIHAFLF